MGYRTGDLDGSLESGRLWAQLRSLRAHYATPCLLLEFSAGTRALDARATSNMSLKRVPDRLAKAALEYPDVRLLWSPSAEGTAGLFRALGDGGASPDAAAAVARREGASSRASRFVEKIPGLEAADARAAAEAAGYSLAGLAGLEEAALAGVIGAEAAKRFVAFCREPLVVVDENTDPVGPARKRARRK